MVSRTAVSAGDHVVAGDRRHLATKLLRQSQRLGDPVLLRLAKPRGPRGLDVDCRPGHPHRVRHAPAVAHAQRGEYTPTPDEPGHFDPRLHMGDVGGFEPSSAQRRVAIALANRVLDVARASYGSGDWLEI